MYDREKIERQIVGFHSYEKLFLRFFPVSYKTFKETFFFREPVTLFLKYFHSEFNQYVSLYESLFYSVENIIPYLRKELTFEKALEYQNIMLLTIDGIEDTMNWEYEFKHSGILGDYSIRGLVNELIPKEIQFLYSKEIAAKYSSLGWDKDLGFWAIYPNHIVCSPEFISGNNDIFKKLSEILK